MSYVIALTGGIGSGKSTVAKMFADLNVPVVDTDAINRELLKKIYIVRKIANKFGTNVLNQFGGIDRKVLRDIIFQKVENRKWLENLLHPLIARISQAKLTSYKAPYGIWIVPLLTELGWQVYADRVLVVDVPTWIQYQRVVQRERLSNNLVRNIIISQSTRWQRIACADDIIDNSGTIDSVRYKVLVLHAKYNLLATKHRCHHVKLSSKVPYLPKKSQVG